MLKYAAGWSYVTDETVEDNEIIRFLFVFKRLSFKSNRLSSWVESTLMMDRNDFNLDRNDLDRIDFGSKRP